MRKLTVEDVSPKAVRSAQLWLMGYLTSTTDTNAEYDEWNHSDGWDLNLYHLDDKVTVSAYPFVGGETDYDRWVCVAEGTVPPNDDDTEPQETWEPWKPCDRCGEDTHNLEGRFKEELNTEERICGECYKKEKSEQMGINNWVFAYADLIDQIVGGKK